MSKQIDYIKIIKKSKRLPEKKPLIRREVPDFQILKVVKIKREIVPKIAKEIKEELKQLEVYRPSFFQFFYFALTVILLLGLVQGAIYLSNAKKASGQILGAATNAYHDLSSASSSLGSQNFADAQKLFDSAQTNLATAQSRLNDFKPLEWIAPQANSADHLLKGASDLAAAGGKLTSALDLLNELKISSSGFETQDLNQKISDNRQALDDSRKLVSQASDEFNAVSSVPLDYSDTLNQAKSQVSELNLLLGKLVGLEDLYLSMFTGQKTYLLIFQNYDEERATGGFIGTYGVLNINDGKIEKLKIESIYNLDGQIYEQIAAPGPMQPLIKRWGIRDANWFADFPTSATKLLSFFEMGDETADGVISTTPQVFENILNLIGPIPMPAYNVTLDSQNFQSLVQFKTSIDYDKVLNQPKKFLDDFAPIFLDKLKGLSKDQWLSLLQILEDNLQQRQIMLYNKDTNTQSQIENLGFSGKILPTNYDYLSIVNSNLGGTKTDLSMDQRVTLSSKILSDGSVIDILKINRKNNAPTFNKDYMRILLPQGSQIISQSGFDNYDYYPSQSDNMQTDPVLAKWDEGYKQGNLYIREESGKTEFAGWVNTQSNEEKDLTLVYEPGFKVSTTYSLLFQKQAGSKPINFTGNLDLGSFKSQWLSNGLNSDNGQITFSSNTNTDDFWGVVISK
jgi:hypothetical protein